MNNQLNSAFSSTTTTTATHSYSIQPNDIQDNTSTSTRSKASHLGITIRGWVPASGRRQPALRAVDLGDGSTMIVSIGGASSWC